MLEALVIEDMAGPPQDMPERRRASDARVWLSSLAPWSIGRGVPKNQRTKAKHPDDPCLIHCIL